MCMVVFIIMFDTRKPECEREKEKERVWERQRGRERERERESNTRERMRTVFPFGARRALTHILQHRVNTLLALNRL